MVLPGFQQGRIFDYVQVTSISVEPLFTRFFVLFTRQRDGRTYEVIIPALPFGQFVHLVDRLPVCTAGEWEGRSNCFG